MRALGVRLSGNTAWLAVVEDRTAETTPDRFELSQEPRPAALLSGLERAEMLLREHAVEAVAVLDAQSNYKPKSYKEARQRLSLETVIELASAMAEVPFTLLSPQAVKGALGLDSAKIQDHVALVVDQAGPRWNERGPAAVAAVAAIQKARS